MKRYFQCLILMCILFIGTKCTVDPWEDVKNTDCSIEAVKLLDDGIIQIGVADIKHNVDTAEAYIYLLDTTNVKEITPEIVVAYGASISPASGQKVSLDENKCVTYKVTSEAGNVRTWKVYVKKFYFAYEGIWKVDKIDFFFWVGEGETWGWKGTPLLSKYFPEVVNDNDNELSIKATGITPENNLKGEFEYTAGDDGLVGSYLYKTTGIDFSYKFKKIPYNQKGNFVFDFKTNSLILNDTIKSSAITLQQNDSVLVITYDLKPIDIDLPDWNSGDYGRMELRCAYWMRYTFKRK